MGWTVEKSAAAALLLYVEDEALLQEPVIVALTEAGYEVLAAMSGAEGIEVLERRGGEVRGLITDINLGTGLDGWDVARKARELMSGLPVVYVSGASHQEWSSRGVPESIMISKPFAPCPDCGGHIGVTEQGFARGQLIDPAESRCVISSGKFVSARPLAHDGRKIEIVAIDRNQSVVHFVDAGHRQLDPTAGKPVPIQPLQEH